MKIFISYSRKDTRFVKKLARDLKKVDYEVWWDQVDLPGGENWVQKIPNAIESSDYVIVVLSLNSAESKWVQKEYTQALDFGRNIIPIKLDQFHVPFALIDLNPIDFHREKYRTNFNKLLAALKYEGEPLVIHSVGSWLFIAAILVLLLLGVVLALILNHRNPPVTFVPTAVSRTTVPIDNPASPTPQSLQAKIIVTYEDGRKTSHDCPVPTSAVILSSQEKIRLELSADMPDEALDQLEWWAVVSGSNDEFGIGKTAPYSSPGEGIISVKLHSAVICTLKIQQ
jgi:hypothetical protein